MSKLPWSDPRTAPRTKPMPVTSTTASLFSAIPGWDAIKRQAEGLWDKLTSWGKTLTASRSDVAYMRAALNKYPQYVSSRGTIILSLEAKQRELDDRYSHAKADIKKILDYLRSWIPGLSDLGILPAVAIGALTAAAILGAAIASHFSTASKERAIVEAILREKLTPEEGKKLLEESKGGIFGDLKTLLLVGIAAAFLIPLLTRRT